MHKNSLQALSQQAILQVVLLVKTLAQLMVQVCLDLKFQQMKLLVELQDEIVAISQIQELNFTTLRVASTPSQALLLVDLSAR